MAEAIIATELPVGSIGRTSLGWWGLLTLIATEGALFCYLIFSYLYLAVQVGPNWGSDVPPALSFGIPMTVLLIANSIAMWSAERAVTHDARVQLLGSLILGNLLVTGFGVLEILDWLSETFTLRTSAYGSAFFILTGFHFAHVVVGALMLLAIIVWSAFGYFDSKRNVPVLIVSAYWHFTDAVWIVLFIILFLAPNVR